MNNPTPAMPIAGSKAPVATEHKPKSLIIKFADKFGVEPTKMMNTLKQTCFRQKDGATISDEQMMALLIVADQYGLNPWTKEIYAFPDKNNGIVPVVGVDGWSRIINSHEQNNGIEFRYSEKLVESDEHKPCPEWCEVIIHRKDREQPTVVREYFDEVYRAPYKGEKNGRTYTVNGPWQTHPKRMLRHKTLIQGSRVGFSFVGIYDEDEADRIIEGNFIDVTPAQPALAAPVTSSATDLNASLGDGEQPAADAGQEPPTHDAGQGPVPTEPARVLTPYEKLEQALFVAKTPEDVSTVLDMGRLGTPDKLHEPLPEEDQAKLKRASALRIKELTGGKGKAK